MENSTHKGSEMKNVQETWDQNEKLRNEGNVSAVGSDATSTEPATEIDQVVKQEASEYDHDKKEDRLLSGERATLNDDTTEGA